MFGQMVNSGQCQGSIRASYDRSKVLLSKLVTSFYIFRFTKYFGQNPNMAICSFVVEALS